MKDAKQRHLKLQHGSGNREDEGIHLVLKSSRGQTILCSDPDSCTECIHYIVDHCTLIM
jgi:hypothetical protein